MKKLTLLLLLVATACTAHNKTTTITVKIESLPDGNTVKLYNHATYIRGAGGAVAEAQVTDGQFVFSLDIDEPRQFAVEAGPQYGNYTVIATPGEAITLTGPSFRGVEMTGSQWQQKFNDLTAKPWREYSAKVKDLSDEERAPLLEEHLKYLQRLIAENSDSFLAPLMIYQFSGNIKPTEEMYDALAEDVKNSFHGKHLRAYLDTFLIGDPAPAFTAKDRDGKEYSLADLLKGNKYLIVDFWASWCAPCRAGIPKMKEFAVKYAGEGLALVNIFTDKDRDAWLQALDEEQMPWTNLHDADGTIKTAYGVNGIPSVFLIGVDGVVIFEKLWGDAIEKELKATFGY